MATPDKNTDSKEIDYEKRFKDTQSAYTKSRQEIKALRAQVKALKNFKAPVVEIDQSKKEELEELKFSDPDAWRRELNKLDEEAKRKSSEAEREALKQAELAARADILVEFNKQNPDIVINDEVLQYDVPPRLTAKLERGEVSFGDFLNEVADYLGKAKVAPKRGETMNQPDLSKVGGGSTPQDTSSEKPLEEVYKDLII